MNENNNKSKVIIAAQAAAIVIIALGKSGLRFRKTIEFGFLGRGNQNKSRKRGRK